MVCYTCDRGRYNQLQSLIKTVKHASNRQAEQPTAKPNKGSSPPGTRSRSWQAAPDSGGLGTNHALFRGARYVDRRFNRYCDSVGERWVCRPVVLAISI